MLKVYAKSIFSGPWGDPKLMTEKIQKAVDEAYWWFDKEGWYSKIVDDEADETGTTVIFEDYHFIDDWQLMY